MARLPHGYTNLTRRLVGGRVEKHYDGPRRWESFRRELACLSQLDGLLPVPKVLDIDALTPRLVLQYVDGRHGQELVVEGHASEVMALAGQTLARLQALPTSTVDGLDGEGDVIVHGDFGPQNMLLDVAHGEVVAVLDWESAHKGQRVEDLAWAEWIIRMHHPDHVEALAPFFAATGLALPWSERHASMVRQCRDILADCDAAGLTEPAQEWRKRLQVTEEWRVA